MFGKKSSLKDKCCTILSIVIISVFLILIVVASLYRIKGNRGSMIYHLENCRSYNLIKMDKNDKWFITEEQAVKAGFRKALNCN